MSTSMFSTPNCKVCIDALERRTIYSSICLLVGETYAIGLLHFLTLAFVFLSFGCHYLCHPGWLLDIQIDITIFQIFCHCLIWIFFGFWQVGPFPWYYWSLFYCFPWACMNGLLVLKESWRSWLRRAFCSCCWNTLWVCIIITILFPCNFVSLLLLNFTNKL